ncbi:MAG: NAD(+)/NADH kinase [Actinomycetota bacterium]
MKVGLTIHASKPAPAAFARKFADAAEAAGHEVVGDDITSRLLGRPVGNGRPEIIIAAGGDGTVLAAARRALVLDVPVLGFNLGTIGFLAEAEVSDLHRVVDALSTGAMVEQTRMTIGARIGDSGNVVLGINDVVMEKIHSQRLVFLQVDVDGETFLTYRADGIVAATSTGSTAYSFSAGGPLVDPHVEALLLTPVAPHSLFNRTLVLKPDARIRIEVTADRPVRVSVDGVETGFLGEGGIVEIARGERPARTVSFDSTSFPQTVKQKFRLG